MKWNHSLPGRQWRQAVAPIALGLAAWFATAPSAWAETIGVVNMDAVLHEAAPAVQAENRLKQEFSAREQEVQRLAKQGQALQAQYAKNHLVETQQAQQAQQSQLAQLAREYEVKQSQLDADLNTRRNQEMAQLQEKMRQAIQQVAQQQKLDLVLYDGVAYNAPATDITKNVIAALANK